MTKLINKDNKYIKADLKIPQLTMGNKSIENNLNKKFETDIMSFYNNSYKEAQSFFDDFPEAENKFIVSSDYEVKKSNDDILSILIKYYKYSGGAHGIYEYVPYNIDLTSGNTFVLNDIFTQNSNYEQVINDEIKSQIKTLNKEQGLPEDSTQLYAFNKIKNNPSIQLIPITTRSYAQFKRVQPVQNLPYAVVANGGIILHNGEPLPEWEKHVDSICRRLEDQYTNILKLLNQYKTHLTKEPVLIDDIFFFTKISDDKTIINYIDEAMTRELDGTEWTHTIQGLKLYIIPKKISKGNALLFLKEKLEEDFVITAGDGKMDQTFLPLGNVRCIPNQSEIYHLLDDKEKYTIVPEGLASAEKILQLVLDYSV